MTAVIVIPARYGSKRFPGKPLALIRGRSLLQRTWTIGKAVSGISALYIATDDERIAAHARDFGAAVVMTPPDCATGTDRVLAAVRTLPARPDIVINLQGDAALTPPWVVQSLVDAMRSDVSVRIATPAVQCTLAELGEIEKSKRVHPESGTFVTFGKNGDALYFSKAIIPHLRSRDQDPPPVYHHIGIYGYRTDALEAFCALPQSPLERAEQLEQLRALQNGIPIRVVLVDRKGRTHWSVDTPADAKKVEEIIAREGELVPA